MKTNSKTSHVSDWLPNRGDENTETKKPHYSVLYNAIYTVPSTRWYLHAGIYTLVSTHAGIYTHWYLQSSTVVTGTRLSHLGLNIPLASLCVWCVRKCA